MKMLDETLPCWPFIFCWFSLSRYDWMRCEWYFIDFNHPYVMTLHFVFRQDSCFQWFKIHGAPDVQHCNWDCNAFGSSLSNLLCVPLVKISFQWCVDKEQSWFLQVGHRCKKVKKSIVGINFRSNLLIFDIHIVQEFQHWFNLNTETCAWYWKSALRNEILKTHGTG